MNSLQETGCVMLGRHSRGGSIELAPMVSLILLSEYVYRANNSGTFPHVMHIDASEQDTKVIKVDDV